MDDTILAHTELFINSYMKNNEAEAMHKSAQFPVVGWVTRKKKTFKQNTLYFKATQEFLTVFPQKEQSLVPAYIEESDLERDNRIVLYLKVDIKTPLAEIDRYFSQAGQIKSIMISRDVSRRELSAEIEFYSFQSVAVAIALAVKDRKTNICTKTKSIRVERFFVENENVIDRAGSWTGDWSKMDIMDQKISISFCHIPMTVGWLEKIFGVFGVVQKLNLPRPINHVHLGYASLQFETINAKEDALRLDKQLKLSYKNFEVNMEVSASDGADWMHDENIKIISEPPEEDDGSL